jgi:hypothetical protein
MNANLDKIIAELEYSRDRLNKFSVGVNLNPSINALKAFKEKLDDEISAAYERGCQSGQEAGYYEAQDSRE